jgi:AraC-like DNA-binding protein
MAELTIHACECEVCQEHPRSAEAMEHRKLNRVVALLDEKQARRVVGLLAEREGHGGVALLSRVTGMSRTTIAQGQRDLVGEDPVPADRVRRHGGGRKPLEKKDRT